MSLPLLLAVATGALAVVFSLVFVLARRIDNYGVVDIAWSYAFGALAAFYALAAPGWPVRRALIAAMVVTWSLRLGTHLAVRVARHHPKEDGRYEQLRQDWSANFGAKMFGFFQMQAVSVVLLGLAFVLIAQNPEPLLKAVEIAGTLLWLIAVTGEAVADRQLAAFKKTPSATHGVCDVGLWQFSRHPNYFFEWLIWVAYFVFALGSPWGGIGIIGPISILWLLLRVTGIPMTEAQSLRSRGDAYRRYQKSTSAFIPWFPKQSDQRSARP
jgi:steroid 5-alpha reductase family enzyme